jgi:hypothetical protein
MTRDDIIRMAREAGWSGLYTQWREPDGSPDWTPVKESLTVPVTMEQIERFAALVAAHEREACAALLDEMAAQDKLSNYYAVAARAIRARGEDPMPLFDDWDGGFPCKESK